MQIYIEMKKKLKNLVGLAFFHLFMNYVTVQSWSKQAVFDVWSLLKTEDLIHWWFLVDKFLFCPLLIWLMKSDHFKWLERVSDDCMDVECCLEEWRSFMYRIDWWIQGWTMAWTQKWSVHQKNAWWAGKKEKLNVNIEVIFFLLIQINYARSWTLTGVNYFETELASIIMRGLLLSNCTVQRCMYL